MSSNCSASNCAPTSILYYYSPPKKYKIVPHARPLRSNVTPSNVIGIVKLKKKLKVKNNNNVGPASLPPVKWKKTDQMGFLSGFGRNRFDDKNGNYDRLMHVTLPIVTNDVCQKRYGKSKLPSGTLCAGYKEGGKDSCGADSGGG